VNTEFHTNKITTVIFDMGRVLVDIDFEAFPRALGIERDHTNHLGEKAIERLAKQYETGRIGIEQFFVSMAMTFKGEYTRQQLVDAWNAIIREENSAMVPIVEAVQAKYQTAILSNTNPTHFKKSHDTTAIIKKFSKSYLSYQIGATKPDPAVYQYVIRDLSVEPSSLLFIDDIAENVYAAKNCGMEGIVFKDVPHLQTELHVRKIL
jgi:glucose-1-phosphatase